MSTPLTGPATPKTMSPSAAASDRSPFDQPVSASMSRRKAPGAVRAPAVTTRTSAVTQTTIQP